MNKFAIIGLGFIYPRHKQSIERLGGEIILTCDIDPAKGADYLDWCEMLRDPKWKEVDYVVICTPNYLHTPMCMAIPDKIILCEKPLAIDNRVNYLPDNVNGVLQLRHHPKLQGLKPKDVDVTAKMFRDDTYWNGWKGNEQKSGGILFNLGIHYIDLLIFLLGNPVRIVKSSISPKLARGEVQFERGVGRYHIEILDSREGQIRKILADGQEVSLSDKDNLSYEDLHVEVYKDLMNFRGKKPSECAKSIKLVQQLCKNA